MKKNNVSIAIKKMALLMALFFFPFIFSGQVNAIDNYGCSAAQEPWVRESETSVIQNLIQQSYPVDNPNANNTGTAVRWRGRTTNSFDTRRQHLIRWDTRAPNDILLNGFLPRRSGIENENVSESNLWTYANSNTPSIFVGTAIVRSRNQVWTPRSISRGTWYAYDIFAPGGIDVNESLGTSYQYRNQYEIAFPGGIQRRYIRSVVQYNNNRVVRVFTNPYFAPGTTGIPARKTSKDKFEWKPNHPLGNNPDTSSRISNDDDPMFGGNGGEDTSVPDDDNGRDPIGDGTHQILSNGSNNVISKSIKDTNDFVTPNNFKSNKQWEFTYNESKDAYTVKDLQTKSSLKNQEFWKIKEISDNIFIFINPEKNSILGISANDLLAEQNWNGSNNVPNNCQWNISDTGFQPLKEGYYQITDKTRNNSFMSASSSSHASPIYSKSYGVEDAKIWYLYYDNDKQAYKIITLENEKLALTWQSTAGNLVSNYTFENNGDQFWYIRINKTGDAYNLINYKDGKTMINFEGDRLTASQKTGDWTFSSFNPAAVGSENKGVYISSKNYPNQVVDLPNKNYAVPLVTHSYTGADNQLWITSQQGTGATNYFMQSVQAGKSHIITWDSSKGSNIIGFEKYYNSDQRWRFVRDPSGYYRIHNRKDYSKVMTYNSNNKLTVSAFSSSSADPFVATNSNQLWNIESYKHSALTNGTYVFASKNNHKNVIDIDKNTLRIRPYVGQSSSVFGCEFYFNGSDGTNGRYRVSNNSNGNNGFSSEWILDYQPDKGAFTIRDFKTNNLLTAHDDRIEYEDANNNNTQLWNIVPK